MPLITCPDCASSVSDRAPGCPSCGYPIARGAGGPAPQPFASPGATPSPPPPPSSRSHNGVPNSTWSPPSAPIATLDQGEPDYYRRKFATFDQAGGSFQATWNWPAFLFGGLWYLFKGMWAKALLIFAVAFISAGFLTIPLWLYAAVAGNYDYYLLKRHGKQLW